MGLKWVHLADNPCALEGGRGFDASISLSISYQLLIMKSYETQWKYGPYSLMVPFGSMGGYGLVSWGIRTY